jgi:hypothetical protein
MTCVPSITVVRYGGDSRRRTAARLYNMKLHSPTRLYDSREKAFEVVRALQSGEMTVSAAPRAEASGSFPIRFLAMSFGKERLDAARSER